MLLIAADAMRYALCRCLHAPRYADITRRAQPRAALFNINADLIMTYDARCH